MYTLRVCAVYTIFYTLVCGREPKSRTINIPNQGEIIGVEVSKQRIQKIIAYYGIPYAQQPLEELRFAPPVTDPLPKWDNAKQDTDYPPSCLQTQDDYKESERLFLQLISKSPLNITQKEDCLYLNVFTPYGEVPDGYATIIWFHPGHFATGSPAFWNPHPLVYRQKVIIVSVSWRLNILGFFTTMDGESSGNMGLMDQQAAMKWVKNNIKYFGGNPDNISIMGYGSGAVSVVLHMINPDSRGLFHKAIVMSGNTFSPAAIKTPEDYRELLDRLADIFGCNRRPTSLLIFCLRGVDPDVLVQQSANTNWGPIIDLGLSNVTDPFLTELPLTFFEKGEFAKIPLLTGYTNMENVLDIESIKNNITNTTTENIQSFFMEMINDDPFFANLSESACPSNFEQIMSALTFFYGPSRPIKSGDKFREILINFAAERNYGASTFLLANYASQQNPNTFMYRFDLKPSTTAAANYLPDWATVPHLVDLLYIWGVPYWDTEIKWDIRDKRISDTIMTFWTNFAKNSNPTTGSIYPVTWNPFDKDNMGVLFIDGNFNMSDSDSLNYKAFEFWNNYFPKIKKIATRCCEEENTAQQAQKCGVSILLMVFLTHLLYHYTV